MATMNVSLPDAMKDWVETQAQSGRYANASDYVRDLIRRDQERQRLRGLLLDGAASAPGETADAGYFARLRAALPER